MKLLFLDIDGVLNTNTTFRFCCVDKPAIHTSHVVHLNTILRAVPDVRVVISSAWRKLIFNGCMTLHGFEHMLASHGLYALGMLHGCTRQDGLTLSEEEAQTFPFRQREAQIQQYVRQNPCSAFVVLDDLDLDLPQLVKIDPREGLTVEKANEAIKLLTPSA